MSLNTNVEFLSLPDPMGQGSLQVQISRKGTPPPSALLNVGWYASKQPVHWSDTRAGASKPDQFRSVA